MGYFIEELKDIAKVTGPAKFSLSSNPNFAEFEAMENAQTLIDIDLNFYNCGYTFIRSDVHGIKIYENVSAFSIIEENTGTEHKFEGTSDLDKIGPGVFYIGTISQYAAGWQYYREKTVESLKNCLMQNEFIRDNFELNQSLIKDSHGALSLGESLHLKSKGGGKKYAFTVKGNERFFSLSGDPSTVADSDSFSEGHSPVELHLELYKDTGVFPGTDSMPDGENMGSLATTLTKSYANNPLWFNVNILESKDYSRRFLNEEHLWFDTGTVRDFRFAAKRLISTRTHYENSLFYYSDVLYLVSGYRRNLETNDLSAYVYDTSEDTKAKPLTNQPALFHIKGQTQYFNFLLSDAGHDNEAGGNLAITYRILSQSGRFLAEKVMHTQPKHLFHAVNTIRLDIDGAISEYPNAGRVEACLSRSLPDEDNYIAVTEPLRFRILPSCLHKVNDFAFLNSLGGWSSFNFAGTDQSEFKTKTNTIFKTHTPDKTVSSELEAVFSKDVEEQFSVQTMPITREVTEWLRELSASKAVYELSTKRYVIVDDLTIKPNSKDELFRLEMKYRYSDIYNAK
ncbi:hypothetical protein [Dysgonomonas reticulitermitis]